MINVTELRSKLRKSKIKIDELLDYKMDLVNMKDRLLKTKVLTHDEFDTLRDLLMIFLDYYNYSESGDVLISDHEYDVLMNHYINNGGSLISKSDKLENQTQWVFVRHENPGMVGTVKKIYTFEELISYFNKNSSSKGRRTFRIAPKFDGISSAIKINANGKILMGITRNDGVEGQDITKVVRNARNSEEISAYYALQLKSSGTCWVKTELCVTSEDFNKLIEEKHYKNRRSATSGIVNSPKNLDLAKYITIIPLASYNSDSDVVDYVPLDSQLVTPKDPYDLMESIEKMLSKIRDAKYPLRTDGVVIYPIGDDILPNFDDIMDNAIAYKVNTEEGLSPVEYGYVSVGRLGYAVPMLKVFPVEVNETTVTDVSLGSFDKFVNMDIHEGEQVLIYSAGDVIPQAKLPEERRYKANAPLLKIKKVCPYCNEKLTRYTKGTYKCENPECFRVQSGRIANFVIKLKAENVSDKTIDELMLNHLIEDIPDIFKLSVNQIAELPGFGEDSAKNIIKEFNKIKNNETSVSTLLGALGIPGISEKKCQKILKVMTIKDMLKTKKDKLVYRLLAADNTGFTTAETFVDFIHSNKKLINKLLDDMNIVNDIDWKGNVVFTGTRNPELEKEFNKIGYEVSNNVNGKTLVVIDASYMHDSTKCKAAKKKGVDIIHISETNELLETLKRRN